jgi:hypothetical protein
VGIGDDYRTTIAACMAVADFDDADEEDVPFIKQIVKLMYEHPVIASS